MSSLTDSSAIFQYHRDMINAHGQRSSLALGWRDRDSQLIRFEALASIADLNGCTVLDAGCGHADLLSYLQSDYPNLAGYCGVEQIPELLDKAIERYDGLPGISFISGSFMARTLPVTDYVFASGSLNYNSVDINFIFKAIAKLYSGCTKGLGFNLLCKVPFAGFLAAYDIEEIMTYCRTLSSNVILKTGYADEDFTVMLYR